MRTHLVSSTHGTPLRSAFSARSTQHEAAWCSIAWRPASAAHSVAARHRTRHAHAPKTTAGHPAKLAAPRVGVRRARVAVGLATARARDPHRAALAGAVCIETPIRRAISHQGDPLDIDSLRGAVALRHRGRDRNRRREHRSGVACQRVADRPRRRRHTRAAVRAPFILVPGRNANSRCETFSHRRNGNPSSVRQTLDIRLGVSDWAAARSRAHGGEQERIAAVERAIS